MEHCWCETLLESAVVCWSYAHELVLLQCMLRPYMVLHNYSLNFNLQKYISFAMPNIFARLPVGICK